MTFFGQSHVTYTISILICIIILKHQEKEIVQPILEREQIMISSSPFWKRKCENLEKDRLTLVKFQFIQTQPIIDKTHLSTVLVLQGGNSSIVLVLQGGNLSKKWTIILLFF